jgi:hypothetical protein
VPLFDTTTLERYYFQAENELSTEHPFLIDRLALPVVANTAIYTLPDYVVSIKRITYLSQKLDPLPQRNFREVFQSAGQKGKPFWYVYNNVGLNQIQLFPNPPDNLPVINGSLFLGANILKGCIVEFYRATDNNTFRVPEYARRQLLKQYAAARLFNIEGPGQNMKLSAYFTQKWKAMSADFYNHLDELYGRPRKLIVNEIVSSNYYPAAPVLPIGQFGISVDEGY